MSLPELRVYLWTVCLDISFMWPHLVGGRYYARGRGDTVGSTLPGASIYRSWFVLCANRCSLREMKASVMIAELTLGQDGRAEDRRV